MTTETPEAPAVDREAAKAAREVAKQDAFKRVAGRRVNAVLKQIELLLRTADTSNYSYTEEQAEKIVTALNSANARVEAAFSGASKATQKVEF